jgi:hypothetical protein
VRQRAIGELEKRGRTALPHLHQALDGKPTLDVRKRVLKLLEQAPASPWPAETLRALRAVWVLEHIGTPEARRGLEALAKGEGAAWETTAARDALDRMGRADP